MDLKIIEKFKNKLIETKNSLQKELDFFAKEDKTLKGNWNTKYPNREDGDKDEEIDELQEYDNQVSVEHSLELKLNDINIALKKIDDGEYGICEKCGKKISEKRLIACPEARNCLKCQK